MCEVKSVLCFLSACTNILKLFFFSLKYYF